MLLLMYKTYKTINDIVYCIPHLPLSMKKTTFFNETNRCLLMGLSLHDLGSPSKPDATDAMLHDVAPLNI